VAEVLKWIVLIVAYYGTGLFFITLFWRKTRRLLPTLAMVAGLWLLAGWDVYFYYPLYGDYCEKEAMFEYYGPCVDDLGMYDCAKFRYVHPSLSKSVTCPLESIRTEKRFGGLSIIELYVYDKRCGKLVYQDKDKILKSNIGGRMFPFFDWMTGGLLLSETCFDSREFWDIDDYLTGSRRKK